MLLTALSSVVTRYGRDPDLALAIAERTGEGLTPSQATAMVLMSEAVTHEGWPADVDAGAAASLLQGALEAALRDGDAIATMLSIAEPPPSEEPVDETSGDEQASYPAPVPTEEFPRAVPQANRPRPTPADELIAEGCGLSAEAVRVLRSVIDGRRETAISERELQGRANTLAALAGRVAPDMSAHDVGAPLRYAAAKAMVSGDLVAAEQGLSLAEDEHLRAAQQDMRRVTFHMSHAMRMRLARAELSELFGAHRRAARHVVAAIRYVPTGDKAMRAALMVHQGRLLCCSARTADAEWPEALEVLKQAVDEAEHAPAEMRAEGLLYWAEAALGAAGPDDPKRLVDAATDALGQAITILGNATTVGRMWGLAQLRLGQAILHKPAARTDVRDLKSAGAAFAAAVATLDAQDQPSEFLEARLWLGLSLAWAGKYGGNLADYEAAMGHLLAIRDAPEMAELLRRSTRFSGALADTAYQLGTRRQDRDLIAAAAELYRELASASDAPADAERGAAFERLAACHWHLGEQSADVAELVRAATALGAAIEIADAVGDGRRAAILRDERERLRAVIEQSSAEQPLGTQASA